MMAHGSNLEVFAYQPPAAFEELVLLHDQAARRYAVHRNGPIAR
jgi:hypothetical protein